MVSAPELTNEGADELSGENFTVAVIRRAIVQYLHEVQVRLVFLEEPTDVELLHFDLIDDEEFGVQLVEFVFAVHARN